MTDLPAVSGDLVPDTVYAKPAEWVATGAGAQGKDRDTALRAMVQHLVEEFHRDL